MYEYDLPFKDLLGITVESLVGASVLTLLILSLV